MNDATLTGQIFAWYYLFSTVFALICYAISAFCLYKIAKYNNICAPWIALIPIFQFYVIGKSIEEYEVFNRKIPKAQWSIFAVIVLQFIATTIPHFGLILGLIVKALWVLLLHKFFYLFNSQRAFLYAILCMFGDIFVNIPFAIIIILLRDSKMINSPGSYEYPF